MIPLGHNVPGRVTFEHIEVRSLCTHIVVEVVGHVSQLGEGESLRPPDPWVIGIISVPDKLVQPIQVSQVDRNER